MEINEQSLMEEIQKGDEKALELLYKHLRINVYSLALEMMKSREDAEEVLQDSFCRVFQKADQYKAQRGSVRAFVYTIARNECISRLRKKQVRPQSSEIDVVEVSAELDSESSNINKIWIDTSLKELKQEEVKLIQKAFYQGQSHKEIAQETGMPLGTVKSRIKMILTKMRSMMEQQ